MPMGYGKSTTSKAFLTGRGEDGFSKYSELGNTHNPIFIGGFN
jgi:hypothetical protein